MIDAIYISKKALNALNINSVTDKHCFQWNSDNFSRIATFDSTASGCSTEINCWFQSAKERKLTPVLLLTSQEATCLLDDLPRDAKIDILPEPNDPRFSEASEEMQEYIYTPETLMVRRWINWKRLGILPPNGAAEEYPKKIWEAYRTGLDSWFKANQTKRHPTAARSLIFSRQKPVEIELSEVDLERKKRTRDGETTFSAIDLPFARFRLTNQNALKVEFGPMSDQELATPSPALIAALRKKSIIEESWEKLTELFFDFNHGQFEAAAAFAAADASIGDEESSILIEGDEGIKIRLGWEGASPETTILGVTLEIKSSKIAQYLPNLNKQQDEILALSLLMNKPEEESRAFSFKIFLAPNEDNIYFDKEKKSENSWAGEYYKEAGDLVISMTLPLGRNQGHEVDTIEFPKITISFESSQKSLTFLIT